MSGEGGEKRGREGGGRGSRTHWKKSTKWTVNIKTHTLFDCHVRIILNEDYFVNKNYRPDITEAKDLHNLRQPKMNVCTYASTVCGRMPQ